MTPILPPTLSPLVARVLFELRACGWPAPLCEHRFHPTRRWRFDLAWPDRLLAVEVDGGTWTGGRHSRGAGSRADCEKLNAAQLAGWTVLRFTSDMVKDGDALTTLEQALDPLGQRCQGGRSA